MKKSIVEYQILTHPSRLCRGHPSQEGTYKWLQYEEFKKYIICRCSYSFKYITTSINEIKPGCYPDRTGRGSPPSVITPIANEVKQSPYVSRLLCRSFLSPRKDNTLYFFINTISKVV